MDHERYHFPLPLELAKNVSQHSPANQNQELGRVYKQRIRLYIYVGTNMWFDIRDSNWHPKRLSNDLIYIKKNHFKGIRLLSLLYLDKRF